MAFDSLEVTSGSESASTSTARVQHPNSRRRTFDWLSGPRHANITPFQQFILDVDWEHSSLGPILQWPTQLRQMVLLIVKDPSPAIIYWGGDAIAVYNEAYTHLIGQKHPALQGQDPKIHFAEIWSHFEVLLAKQRDTGETIVEANAFLPLRRHGFLEETYFSWKFVPIIGDEGWVVGSHATVVEVTREVILDRRLTIVQNLRQELSTITDINDLWRKLLLGLELAEKDVPHALLYSVTEPREINECFQPENPITCKLEGKIGIPTGHRLAPEIIKMTDNEGFLATCFREALCEMAPLLYPISLENCDGYEEIKWRGFGVPSTQLAVCPIIPSGSKEVVAFLAILLNPRRPYDIGYQNFLLQIVQRVSTPQLSAIMLRDEIAKQQRSAKEEALDRDRLYRELSESESKFARFTARAPIGLAILNPEGLALSANDLWRELTQLEVGSAKVSWSEVLVEGETEVVDFHWNKMLAEKKSQTFQTKVRKPWRAPDLDGDGNIQWSHTHLILVIYPDFNEKQEISSVMSCMTDVSSLKWTESQLRRRMDQAIEMKEQQERFIDMTSHEMRNPLSALIGCADEILHSLNELRNAAQPQIYSAPKNTLLEDSNHERLKCLHLLDEAVEAADTIIYCAMHQKRIIDDILTLSRLDSNLLLVSPEPSQPIELIKNSLKMFEAELKRAEIGLDFIEKKSLKDLYVDWTLLDPSRVLQVLINLITNAIKFTRTEAKRHIKITMGASFVRPSEINEFGVQYVTKNQSSPDQTTKAEWGDGEVIFISMTVEDTGKGLSESEIKNLFHLFSQASPKTHQTYGGSGLGLFISRQLVEMQGGEIGVASQAGVGSTFQFYIKTRRTGSSTASQNTDIQLMVRQDALREACAVEMSITPNGVPKPGVLGDQLPPITPPSEPTRFDILVVEDNLVNQKVVTKQLRKAGHTVSVANHGEEALDFIQRSTYWNGVEDGENLHVVLMDLEMPIMDGLTCVKKIRELQHSGDIKGHIPIIAVTANARKDQILNCINSGMDDVTTKPYRMQDMLKQIEAVATSHNFNITNGIL